MKSDLAHFYRKGMIEAGCDEAGRGSLAGPVVAAAVVLPYAFSHELLNDSKKMTAKQRKMMRQIIESEAIDWAVASVSSEEIDSLNISNATFLAMTRAIQSLKIKPQHLLIDGNRFKSDLTIPYTCIVKGDGKFTAIAAASVLAKTWRDEYMESINEEYPIYNWSKNKGYPTHEHFLAIGEHGITKYHRRSFKLIHD